MVYIGDDADSFSDRFYRLLLGHAARRQAAEKRLRGSGGSFAGKTRMSGVWWHAGALPPE